MTLDNPDFVAALLIGGVVMFIVLWFALLAAVNRAAEKRRYRQ